MGRVSPGSSSTKLPVESPTVTNGGFLRLVDFIKREHLKRKSAPPIDQKATPIIEKYKAAQNSSESELPQKGLQLDKAA